jgi:enterochelin esterase-like enzyme
VTLTGTWFFVLTVGAAIAAFVITVLCWPHARRDGVPAKARALLTRAGLLLTVNALVLLVAGTALNDTYQFYADWTDLGSSLFSSPPKVTAEHSGGSTAQTFGSKAIPTTPPRRARRHRVKARLAYDKLVAEAGVAHRLRTYTVHGPRSGLTGTVGVVLPKTYGDARYVDHHYPVLEAYHGFPGAPFQGIDAIHLNTHLDSQVAAGKIADTMIVAPQLEIPNDVDTECLNGVRGTAQIETWITQDIPTWVKQHFRVQTARTSWSTIGLSMGGWCAAMSTMLHPQTYSAGIILGGYFLPSFGDYHPYPRNSWLTGHYDLPALAKRNPPPVALWLESSRRDDLSFPSTQKLLAAARAPTSINADILTHAGHRSSVWEALLNRALDWLGRTVPGFHPSPTAQHAGEVALGPHHKH